MNEQLQQLANMGVEVHQYLVVSGNEVTMLRYPSSMQLPSGVSEVMESLGLHEVGQTPQDNHMTEYFFE